MPLTLKQIRKRDGRLVPFEKEKIAIAVGKAGTATGEFKQEIAAKVADIVAEKLEKVFDGRIIPSVEQVQDFVEATLMQESYYETAKAYILYRQEHEKIRQEKAVLGIEDDLGFSVNALKILKQRYLIKDKNGRVIEKPSDLFRRVAENIALADKKFTSSIREIKQTTEDFYQILSQRDFLPNSPTLRGAGRELQQLSACFVIPVEDNIESIFDAIKYTAMVHKTGGGTGFSFGRLRPKGDRVGTTGGVASGPVSFMRIFNATTQEITQGGTRVGANMGILPVDHPDILEFVACKQDGVSFRNFNISVALTDKFMKAVQNDQEYELINPHNNQVTNKIKARSVFNLIVDAAWRNGDPGVIFIDRINRDNPTPLLGRIEATNPCGEQPLMGFESCNLGSINLSQMVVDKKIDWKKLEKITRLAVHFLDNVISVNKFVLPQIESMTLANRKIGLGVMGFADMLIKLRIPYNSDEGLKIAEKTMKFITEIAHSESEILGEKRGNFPNFSQSFWPKKGFKNMRNAALTTIAPTGTLSTLADCSSGIEPTFALTYTRLSIFNENGAPAEQLTVISDLFEQAAKECGFYSEDLMREVAIKGSLKEIAGLPEWVKKVFVVSHEISPEWHLKMQAAFQKYVDNAVSKTINFPHSAAPEDVYKSYLLAYKLGCKGVTIYRDGSRDQQVLNINYAPKKEDPKEEHKKDKSICPQCGQKMRMAEGCHLCHNCGYSGCGLK